MSSAQPSFVDPEPVAEWNVRRVGPRFAIRTIHDGRVRIFGKTYAPKREYHGELDDQRFAFARYPAYVKSVYLWGTEEQYRADSEEEFERLWLGPHCVDGVFRWEWWGEVVDAS